MTDPATQFEQRRYLIPFRSILLPQIFTDTLVIGSGAAGLTTALGLAERGHDVIVLAKGPVEPAAQAATNTAWAQGGVAAVLEPGDEPAIHASDTHIAGAGLCDDAAVKALVNEGPDALRWLMEQGLTLDADAGGRLSAGREGGHTENRIYHAGGDRTGAEFQRALGQAVGRSPNIRVFDGCFALDLITGSDRPGARVLGAITHHPRFGLQMIWARTTVLASGGGGALFRESTNPAGATCDGLAMAYRAGASVADTAFVQFHPTVLYVPGAARALVSEAVRGEGALLLDTDGVRFMSEAHPQAELAPRDVVSRAIVDRVARTGGARGSHVWLDCRPINGFAERFPGIAATLKRYGLNPEKDLVPVHPAAHYMVGGVRTDLDGRSDVPGLYAVGEAASNGIHGANRLASNSLLEALVFGLRTARSAGEENDGVQAPAPAAVVSDIPPSDHAELDLEDVRSSLRSAMWRNVGIVRTESKLADTAEMLGFWARYTLDKIFDAPSGWEVQNLLLAGWLVARSAAWRMESRGCHRRDDASGPVESFAVHDLWRRGQDGCRTVPVDTPADVGVER